jgi:hypothetical protein
MAPRKKTEAPSAQRYPIVVIQSERAAKNGMSVKGLSGQGVILPDDPDTVYVTTDTWYGDWPLDETNIPALRKAEEDRRKREEELAKRKEKIESGDAKDAYERLVEKLKEANPSIPVPDYSTRSYLLTRDGRYVRIPTPDEFTKGFAELDGEGKVEP